MKRCPSCQRTYEDDTQSFCMNDGTPLVSEAAPSSLDKTMMSGSLGAPPVPPQSFNPAPGTPQGEWAAPSWPPNPTWQQPGAGMGAPPPQKKSKLPWILAGVAVLLIGLVGIGGVAAYFLLGNSNENSNSKRGLGFNINKNEKEGNTNSSSAAANTNANTSGHSHDNTNASSSDEVPTDKELVTKQLYDLEYAWCAADLKADKAAMDRILATEFVVTNPDGTTMNKQQYLAQMKPDEYNRTCAYSDFSLGQSANYAVIIGYNTVKGRDANGPFTERSKFTDTFIWRDGRWQATASKSQTLK